jgi:hypothetical protein
MMQVARTHGRQDNVCIGRGNNGAPGPKKRIDTSFDRCQDVARLWRRDGVSRLAVISGAAIQELGVDVQEFAGIASVHRVRLARSGRNRSSPALLVIPVEHRHALVVKAAPPLSR